MLRNLSFAVLLSACAAPQVTTQEAKAPPASPPAPRADDRRVIPRGFEPAVDGPRLAEYVATRGGLLGTPRGWKFTPDGSRLVFLRSGARELAHSLWIFDLASGQERELASPGKLLAGGNEKLSAEEKARRERQRTRYTGFTSFEITPDGKSLLTTLSGRVYRIGLDDGAASLLVEPESGEAPFDARLSADGGKLGFVRGGELWVVPASGGKPLQLTRGAGGMIEHAQAEFIAQEELDRDEGYWFSPDGKRVLYQISDATGVERVHMVDPADPYAPPRSQPYPRPGKKNVAVSLALVATDGKGKPLAVSWDRERYPYLARVQWPTRGPLTLVVLSRDQKDLALLAVDDKSGQSRELLLEHDDVFLNLPIAYEWLADGSGFLWASERAGAWQLELRAPGGALVRVVTEPDLGFHGLRWVDPAGQAVIVQAAAEPVDDGLYRVPLAGGPAEPIGPRGGAVTGVFARDVPAHVLMQIDEKNEKLSVVRADGTVAGTPLSVADKLAPANLEVVKLGEDDGLWTAIIRPRDFDGTKKYPVLVSVYGGPHSLVVSRSARKYAKEQSFADHGYIVVLIDGRGTPGRGRAFERAIAGRFHEVPLEDQVAGLQALAAHEPAMDLGRVGIYGGSFGGYMAALAVLRRPDVFHAAIASALVADWLDYDTAYTERYLGVPDLGGDTAVYEANGLMPYAAELSRPLLVLHGTADDNVHFSHALDLADALFRAGKRFELVTLGKQTHSTRDPGLIMATTRRTFDFFAETLK